MRILYIHQHFSTPDGSGGTRSYQFARKLVERGHQVTMVCGASERSTTNLEMPFTGNSRRGVVEGIEVIEYRIGSSTHDSILARVRKFTRFGIQASRIALTEQYDVIFATSTPLTAGIPGILARWLRRKPFVFEVRDLWPELPMALGVKNPLLIAGMRLLEWASYHSAINVIGLAPGIVRGIEKRGIAKDRIALIPNAADIEEFSVDPEGDPLGPWRDRIAPDNFVAVYAGAHGIANGLDAVLDAAAELKRRGSKNIKLLLIGSGATKQGLMERAEAEELLDNVVFSPPIPKLQLVPVLRAADAGLQILKNVPAFYRGTSPNKFFDYIAAQLPVFVNSPGWIAELVEEYDAGLAVPPDNSAAFADTLERAANDRMWWRRKSGGAARLAAEKFDRSVLAREFAQVIERSLPGHLHSAAAAGRAAS